MGGSQIGRRFWLARGGAVLALPALGACGFRPVYGLGPDGAASPAQAELAAINVPVMGERSGQLLRQALQERFERAGLPAVRKYDLVVAYGVSGEGIAVQPDTSVTRIRLVGSATWSLLAEDAYRSTITSGSARTVDGYNILNQQYFASDLNSETVQRRVAEAVADQISLQLATFFLKRATSG